MNARYLIWSDTLGAWLGPDQASWTHFIRDAGRYQLNEANAAAQFVSAEEFALVLAPESLQQLLDTVSHALHAGEDLDDEAALSRASTQ